MATKQDIMRRLVVAQADSLHVASQLGELIVELQDDHENILERAENGNIRGEVAGDVRPGDSQEAD